METGKIQTMEHEFAKENFKPRRAGLNVFKGGYSWLMYILSEPLPQLQFLNKEDGVSGKSRFSNDENGCSKSKHLPEMASSLCPEFCT